MKMRMEGLLPFKAGQEAYLFDASSPLPVQPCTVSLVTGSGVIVTIDEKRVLLSVVQALQRLLTDEAYRVLRQRLPASEEEPSPEPAPAAGGLHYGALVRVSVKPRGKISREFLTEWSPATHGYVTFGVIAGRRKRAGRWEVKCPKASGGYGLLLVPNPTAVPPIAAVPVADVPHSILKAINQYHNTGNMQ